MILALGVYLRPKGTDEDWRGGMIGILEVSTLADEETIKKLPIYIRSWPSKLIRIYKNCFIGARGAFKLISDAWECVV